MLITIYIEVYEYCKSLNKMPFDELYEMLQISRTMYQYLWKYSTLFLMKLSDSSAKKVEI